MFFQQHSAVLTDDSHVYLLDNQGYSVGETKDNPQTQILKFHLDFKTGETKLVFNRRFHPRRRQVLRGNLVLLPDKDIFTYLPGSFSGNESFSVINELTRKSIYQLRIFRPYYNASIRAFPIFSNNGDTYQKVAFKKQALAPTDAEISQDILEFSY